MVNLKLSAATGRRQESDPVLVPWMPGHIRIMMVVCGVCMANPLPSMHKFDSK